MLAAAATNESMYFDTVLWSNPSRGLLEVIEDSVIDTFSDSDRELLRGLLQTPLLSDINKLAQSLSHFEWTLGKYKKGTDDFFTLYLKHRDSLLASSTLETEISEFYFRQWEAQKLLERITEHMKEPFGWYAWQVAKLELKKQGDFVQSILWYSQKISIGMQWFLKKYIKFLSQRVLNDPRFEEYMFELDEFSEEELIDTLSPYTSLSKRKREDFSVFTWPYNKNKEIPNALLAPKRVDELLSYLLMDDDSLKIIFGNDLYKALKHQLLFLKNSFAQKTWRFYVKNPRLIAKEKESFPVVVQDLVATMNKNNNKGTYEKRLKILHKYSEKWISSLDTIFVNLKESVAVMLVQHILWSMWHKVHKSGLVEDFEWSDFFVDGIGYDLKITNDSILGSDKTRFKYDEDKLDAYFLMPRDKFYAVFSDFFEKLFASQVSEKWVDYSAIREDVLENHVGIVDVIKRRFSIN